MNVCPNIIGFFYNNKVSDISNIQFNNIQKFLKTVQNIGCKTLQNYVANKLSKVTDESSSKLSCSTVFNEIKTDVLNSNYIELNTKNTLVPILQDIVNSICTKNTINQAELKTMIIEFNKSFCYQEW